MKAKKAKHNEIRQMSQNKLLEKQEKLKELDIENDNQRKLIIFVVVRILLINK